MKKTLYILFIVFVSSCDSDITQNVNYLWDNGNYEVYPYDEKFVIGNVSAIDSLKGKLSNLNPKEFSLDVYPYSFGPEYDLKNEPIIHEHGDKNGWPLGFLTDFSSIEKLSIGSVCNFTFKINSKNNLKHFKLSSHSCGRIYAKEPIHFSELKNLESLHINRYAFRPRELEGVSNIDKLESLTLTDCELDMRDLIGLKKQLRYLNISDSKVFNWQLLSDFKQLEVLYIANIENIVLQNNDNIKFLSGLKKLRELSVKRNSINNLEWVKNLNNLEKIYIQKTEIKDIPTELKKKKDLIIFK
jgi:Leucine-rich repeat (LRR) protein